MKSEDEPLSTLLSQVFYNRSYDALDNLRPVQIRLEKDADGSVARFLTEQLSHLAPRIRSGITFSLAVHYLERGDLAAIGTLYASTDAAGQEGVLNGLWEEPSASPELGPGIVALAIEGMTHSSPEVRTEAASVIQNQSAWGVSVADALDPLCNLLADPVARVRHQTAYAIGNLAKRKYDLAPHLPLLVTNLNHEAIPVRSASAWALWHLSKKRYDIASAIPGLVALLADPDAYHDPYTHAAGALLHHARKSAENLAAVQQSVADASLVTDQKEVARFLQKLGALEEVASVPRQRK